MESKYLDVEELEEEFQLHKATFLALTRKLDKVDKLIVKEKENIKERKRNVEALTEQKEQLAHSNKVNGNLFRKIELNLKFFWNLQGKKLNERIRKRSQNEVNFKLNKKPSNNHDESASQAGSGGFVTSKHPEVVP